MGLFASLLIGTILDTLGDQFHWDWLVTAAGYASSATGIAIAVAIGVSFRSSAGPVFSAPWDSVLLSRRPAGVIFAVIVAAELGKAVSRETKVDILVTPTITILSGLGVGSLIGPGVSLLMNGFGQLIIRATQLRPFLMGIIVSVVGRYRPHLAHQFRRHLLYSSLTGLAGGAATAGCCAQMIGFAVMSFAENGWGGLVAQGLGTSMLQMGNIVKKSRIWLPPTLAAAITGPVCYLHLPPGKRHCHCQRHGHCGWSAPSASSAGMALAARSTGLDSSPRLLCCRWLSLPHSLPCLCAASAGSNPATANWICN